MIQYGVQNGRHDIQNESISFKISVLSLVIYLRYLIIACFYNIHLVWYPSHNCPQVWFNMASKMAATKYKVKLSFFKINALLFGNQFKTILSSNVIIIQYKWNICHVIVAILDSKWRSKWLLKYKISSPVTYLVS